MFDVAGAEVEAMCQHIPTSAFAAILPGELYLGAPLLRYESLPGQGVIAMSNNRVCIWCIKCFMAKRTT